MSCEDVCSVTNWEFKKKKKKPSQPTTKMNSNWAHILLVSKNQLLSILEPAEIAPVLFCHVFSAAAVCAMLQLWSEGSRIDAVLMHAAATNQFWVTLMLAAGPVPLES